MEEGKNLNPVIYNTSNISRRNEEIDDLNDDESDEFDELEVFGNKMKKK